MIPSSVLLLEVGMCSLSYWKITFAKAVVTYLPRFGLHGDVLSHKVLSNLLLLLGNGISSPTPQTSVVVAEAAEPTSLVLRQQFSSPS